MENTDKDLLESKIITEKTTYFTGLKDNKNIIDNDHSKNYIIFQNDFLHFQVKTLEDKIVKLSSKIKTLEIDNENLETAKNNLKHYVKNEHELYGHYKQITELYEEEINKFKNEFYIMLRKLAIVSISFTMMSLLIMYFQLSLIGIFLAFIIYGTKLIMPFSHSIQKILKLKNDNRITKHKFEIQQANLGNKYIDDLIDNF